jgi:hypothetical protein
LIKNKKPGKLIGVEQFIDVEVVEEIIEGSIDEK